MYYKDSNSVEHVPGIIAMRGCSYCGCKELEKSVFGIEKCKSLGEWYELTKSEGYNICVIMCAGIDRAAKKWGLSVPEVFRLFLACEIIILKEKIFFYNIQGHEAIKKLYAHHCYHCDIYRINLLEHSDCPECGRECYPMVYKSRNNDEATCGGCFKELAPQEGFLIGYWLHGYYRCRNCAAKQYPHLKIYFRADP